ncbi:hypothetical protein [Natrinema gelatinilyticum]|uniref:hypothetical protein n=1 Tax=Natrinema gelatinilyticum TaxID=2961571 RepID=UPI0020C3B114|nr:hypothetical protein [Natrinema gelatinilyticum]
MSRTEDGSDGNRRDFSDTSGRRSEPVYNEESTGVRGWRPRELPPFVCNALESATLSTVSWAFQRLRH